MSRLWPVVKRDDHMWIDGGKQEWLLILRHDEGDCDTPSDEDMMLRALYDEYQCNDIFEDGDVFSTPFGEFVCRGVHVVRMT